MKSIAVCYREHAIKVSDSYCSGLSNPVNSSSLQSSIRNVVTCLYKVKLSERIPFLIGLIWDESIKPGFSIGIWDFPLSSSSKITQSYRQIHKIRGSKALESGAELTWDLSRAEYGSGPEPVSSFYIMVSFNSEKTLVLGDRENELNKERVSLVSRSEVFSGNSSSYSTKVKFSETGMIHEIVVKCGKEEEEKDKQQNVLDVFIDKKKVICVKKLQLNFRGNQTIFIDGLVVDLMWDVHDFLFSSGSGTGGRRFLFRTRSGLDSRLWVEENCEPDKTEFSLLISAVTSN